MPKLIGYDEFLKPVYRESIIDHKEFISAKKRCIEIYITRAKEACDKEDISTAIKYRDMALVASGLVEQLVSAVRELEEIQAQWTN